MRLTTYSAAIVMLDTVTTESVTQIEPHCSQIHS
jgi:hypothetical protein